MIYYNIIHIFKDGNRTTMLLQHIVYGSESLSKIDIQMF